MKAWRQDARRIARYIANHTDEGRDRVLEAQDWRKGVIVDELGRCLIGHAEDAVKAHGISDDLIHGPKARVGASFDRTCERYSLARTVAFCKKRSARPNRVCVPVEQFTHSGRVT